MCCRHGTLVFFADPLWVIFVSRVLWLHSVFVGTWNVAAQAPSQSLHPWLFPSELEGRQPDIYLIGYAASSTVMNGTSENV